LTPIIQASAQKHNLDPALVRAVIQQESSGNPSAWNKTGGGQGAAGLMQVRAPALSDYNSANGTKYTMQDLLKPEVGADVGSWYLGQQLDRFNDPRKALAAYKDGAGSQAAQTGNSLYAQQVLGRINMPQAKSQTLPGIPVGQQSDGMSDDAIFSAFSGGAPVANAQQAQNGPTDDQIFAAFSKTSPQPTTTAKQQLAPQTTASPGVLESIGAGLGKGFGSTVLGAQQLLGHGLQSLGSNSQGMTQGGSDLMGMIGRAGNWLVNDANRGISQLNQQYVPYSQAHPVAASAGNIGGALVATAPLAAVAPVARTYLGAAGIGAGMGAASGALAPVENDQTPNLTSLVTGQQPTDFWSEKLKQLGLGAATGGILSPALMAVGRGIAPQVSADVQRLMDAGVTPTPGQILGGGFARTEAKLSSVPVLGDLIKNSQQRAIQDFNRAAYNEVLAPIGATYEGPAGQQAIGAVRNAIRQAYDDSLGRMSFQATDPGFQADIMRLTGMAQQLPNAQRQTFMNTLRTQVFGKVGPQGNMDGQTLKGVQEELGDLARGYAGDASFDNRQLGAAIGEIRSAIEGSLARTNPADAVEGLANANAAYARFARVRAAAASQGAMNNEGIFTAAQLQNAVKASDRSAGKGATATGTALMQDLSGAGQRVLGSKYPDSGTAGRGLMALLAPGGIAAGLTTAPGPTLATLGGIGLGSLPYTTAGQRAVAALLTARPQFANPIGNAVAQFGPRVVAGSLPALLSPNP
jgi:hypothetical protein